MATLHPFFCMDFPYLNSLPVPLLPGFSLLGEFVMTKEEAIRKALDYVQAAALELGPVVDVKYIDLNYLDEKSANCLPDLADTYNSVRKSFCNQRVVTFKMHDLPGQVSCPGTRLVCLFENGEVEVR
jgi:hypothetical protein